MGHTKGRGTVALKRGDRCDACLLQRRIQASDTSRTGRGVCVSPQPREIRIARVLKCAGWCVVVLFVMFVQTSTPVIYRSGRACLRVACWRPVSRFKTVSILHRLQRLSLPIPQAEVRTASTGPTDRLGYQPHVDKLVSRRRTDHSQLRHYSATAAGGCPHAWVCQCCTAPRAEFCLYGCCLQSGLLMPSFWFVFAQCLPVLVPVSAVLLHPSQEAIQPDVPPPPIACEPGQAGVAVSVPTCSSPSRRHVSCLAFPVVVLPVLSLSCTCVF